MYEQEKQRATHLTILLVYTFLVFGLIGESLLLGWDTGAIVLLFLGMAASWVLHITEKIPELTRLWLYFTLSMLTFFFYGIHETSVYDLAPLMLVIIIMYSITEMYSIIRLCVLTYFLTMGYDFVFVIGSSMEITSLIVTRTILHLVLVALSGYLVKVVIQRRKKERINTANRIDDLEETNRRAEDFLANVSHELRTPINVVTGITTVMLKNEEDADKKKDIFSIQMAGHRLFGQIEDILDFTEIDTRKITVSEGNYMLSSVVNDVITGSRLFEKENMPELIFDIDATIPSVLFGDEKKVKKILRHLLDNAIKFTHKGGVYIRIFALPKSYGINLCIQISDTGVGIGEEEVGRITEQFYQSSRGRNRKSGGLGLGLPIVYGMVAAMKGFMQIESTEGKGTTVSVSIPQRVSDETSGMKIVNREKLCMACFLIPEKYEVPEVRDYYNAMISHMIQGLDITLHRVSNMDELVRLTSLYQLTHLFTGKEEYEANESYFEGLDDSIDVIVVADNSFHLASDSRVKILRKPFFCLPVVNMLNASIIGKTETLDKKNMICPGVKALVVDDEPMNLIVAEGILGDYQMTVQTVESGRKAIEICEKEDFDLIFLDHMMPEMDGVEAIKKIRKVQEEQNKTSTIIAFTANAVSGAREMFLQEGFDEFISKPIESLEMERVLKKVLPKSLILYEDGNFRKNMQRQEAKKQDIPEDKIEDRQIPENDGEDDKMSRLENAGIHTRSGMQYCRGDKEFYIELLTKFAKDANRKKEEIIDFFKQEDYENYCIRIHSLKSTAKMIGADSLSENARQMEAAAKSSDADYIKGHHEELLAQYQEVIQYIVDVFDLVKDEAIQKMTEDNTEISVEQLVSKLTELKEELDTYEADKAEAAIAKIDGLVYQGVSVGKILRDVQQDIDDFEFGAAVEKVETFIRKVEGGEV